MRAVVAIAWTCAVAACTAAPPEVDAEPGDGLGDGPAFADTILVAQRGGALEGCTAGLTCPVDPGCGASPSLGAPDDVRFDLGPGDRLEVAFVCGAILDQGVDAQDDFRVWADVPEGSRALVSVSDEPTGYRLVDTLVASDQTFDLERANLGVARFVQIVHDGGEPIGIDAVEAFRGAAE